MRSPHNQFMYNKTPFIQTLSLAGGTCDVIQRSLTARAVACLTQLVLLFHRRLYDEIILRLNIYILSSLYIMYNNYPKTVQLLHVLNDFNHIVMQLLGCLDGF